MLLSTNSGGSSQKEYVNSVFSTYLYTGNGSTQTINNGIDLADEGGLVWIKNRQSAGTNHFLVDTARGRQFALQTNTSAAHWDTGDELQYFKSFNTDGFTLASGTSGTNSTNSTAQLFTSWTFRKAPKFFDVVTYTGNGVNGRQISHSFGATPGMVIVKCTSAGTTWQVRHRSSAGALFLNQNSNAITSYSSSAYSEDGVIGSMDNTAFTLTQGLSGRLDSVNGNGQTYIAYLFAHDDSEDGIIQCGSYVGNGIATGPEINLGWEPQYLLTKAATLSDNWQIHDIMRAFRVNGSSALLANSNLAESSSTTADYARVTSTGFAPTSSNSIINGNGQTYIYLAIRRPNKPPTSGTEVFQPIAYTSTDADNRLIDTGIVTDMVMTRPRAIVGSGTKGFLFADRLRGDYFLGSAITAVEISDADTFMTPTAGYGNSFSAMSGYGVGDDVTYDLNKLSQTVIAYAFKRAAGFFDEVCYTGTGVARTVPHSLGVAPELMIVKTRGAVTEHWGVIPYILGTDKTLSLNSTEAAETRTDHTNDTAPTSSVFTVGTSQIVNDGSRTYVAYLFATLPGISKCGNYTGNGTTQTINCGFTTGARFILIKRTDAAGDWYVWDSVRGIVAANDPHLSLNTAKAEVTTDDSVDPYPLGVSVVQNTATNINVLNATYIYLAIA